MKEGAGINGKMSIAAWITAKTPPARFAPAKLFPRRGRFLGLKFSRINPQNGMRLITANSAKEMSIFQADHKGSCWNAEMRFR